MSTVSSRFRPLGWAMAWLAFLLVTAPLAAEAGRTVVRRGPRGTTVVHRGPRRTVVVHKGWPLRRTLPHVYVRPARTALLVATPRLYLAPLIWAPIVLAPPAGELLVWQDTDKFTKDDDWTESTFPVNGRGTRLVLKIDGRLEISFAEVVFENGDSQVVDFDDKPLKEGSYQLLDFNDGRMVSHVRMVAKSASDESAATVFLAK